jgi:LacI family transcriptional regulator
MLEVLRGVSEALESSDYSLTLFTMTQGRSSMESFQARLRGQAVDGLAIMQPPYDSEGLRRLASIGAPNVAIDDRGAHPSLASVASADEAGIAAAVAHLASLGRTRLAMIAGPTDIPCHRDRLAAFRKAAAELGLEVDADRQVVAGLDSFGAGAVAADELIARDPTVDGVLVGNDAMALGALRALKRQGRRVPDDVALTGFDDITAARYADPPLTTVYNPLYEMGLTAARLLLDAASGGPLPQSPVLLPTRLLVRRSTDPTAVEPEDDLVHWRSGGDSWAGA